MKFKFKDSNDLTQNVLSVELTCFQNGFSETVETEYSNEREKSGKSFTERICIQ